MQLFRLGTFINYSSFGLRSARSERRCEKTQALMGATRLEAADKIAVYRVKSSFSSLF